MALATAVEGSKALADVPWADESDLVERLRRRDESAFAELVERHQATLVRLALLYVPNRATAEDVVQETWLGVLNGIERFEGRASLRTWLCRILINRARTRGQRDGRSVAFSELVATELAGDEPAVAADRFHEAGPHPGHWSIRPQSWTMTPEEHLTGRETLAVCRAAIDALPPAQRLVVTMRDVNGWSAEEVCAALGLSDGNQRVLLHRGRAKVRAAFERHLDAVITDERRR